MFSSSYRKTREVALQLQFSYSTSYSSIPLTLTSVVLRGYSPRSIHSTTQCLMIPEPFYLQFITNSKAYKRFPHWKKTVELPPPSALSPPFPSIESSTFPTSTSLAQTENTSLPSQSDFVVERRVNGWRDILKGLDYYRNIININKNPKKRRRPQIKVHFSSFASSFSYFYIFFCNDIFYRVLNSFYLNFPLLLTCETHNLSHYLFVSMIDI